MGIIAILAFLFFLLSGFGLPMGSPPGDEDARMLLVAPEDCFLYSSWAGVAEVDENAGPTEKWLAQPTAENFVLKIRHLALKYMILQYPPNPIANDEMKIREASTEALLVLAEIACAEPAAVVLRSVTFDEKMAVKVDGFVVVRLGKQQDKFQQLHNQWVDAIKNLADEDGDRSGDRDESNPEPRNYSIINIGDGQAIRATGALSGLGALNTEVLIFTQDDLAIMATSEDEFKLVLANLKTPAPMWLTKLRTELQIDRVSSTSYLNWTKTVGSLRPTTLTDDWLGIRWGNFLQETTSIGTVVGLDSKLGCVSQSKIQVNPDSDSGFLNILGDKPLEIDDLRAVPNDKTIAIAGKMNPTAIVNLIEDLTKNKGSGKKLQNAMDEIEEFTGVKIKEQVINSLGELVLLQIDVFYRIPFVNWRLDIEIEEEMTFPDVFRQINERMKNTIEGVMDGEVTQQKVDLTNFYFFKSRTGRQELAWGLNDTRLLIGDGNEVELISEKVPLTVDRQLAEVTAVKDLFELGEKNEWGKPIAVVRVNFSLILDRFGPILNQLRENDSFTEPQSSFRTSDIPSIEVFQQGASPSILAVYRVDDGFIVRRQQTYPSSSPISMIAVGIWGAMAGALR